MSDRINIPLAPANHITRVASDEYDFHNLRDLYNYHWINPNVPSQVLAYTSYTLPMTYNPHSIDGLVKPFELSDILDFILTEFSLKIYYEGSLPFPTPNDVDMDEDYTSILYNLIEVRQNDYSKIPLTPQQIQTLQDNSDFITHAIREIAHNLLPFVWNFHHNLPPPLKNPWPRERCIKLLSIVGGRLCIGVLPNQP